MESTSIVLLRALQAQRKLVRAQRDHEELGIWGIGYFLVNWLGEFQGSWVACKFKQQTRFFGSRNRDEAVEDHTSKASVDEFRV